MRTTRSFCMEYSRRKVCCVMISLHESLVTMAMHSALYAVHSKRRALPPEPGSVELLKNVSREIPWPNPVAVTIEPSQPPSNSIASSASRKKKPKMVSFSLEPPTSIDDHVQMLPPLKDVCRPTSITPSSEPSRRSTRSSSRSKTATLTVQNPLLPPPPPPPPPPPSNKLLESTMEVSSAIPQAVPEVPGEREQESPFLRPMGRSSEERGSDEESVSSSVSSITSTPGGDNSSPSSLQFRGEILPVRRRGRPRKRHKSPLIKETKATAVVGGAKKGASVEEAKEVVERSEEKEEVRPEQPEVAASTPSDGVASPMAEEVAVEEGTAKG